MSVEKMIKYSLFLRQCKVYQPAQSQRKKGAKKTKKKKLICELKLRYILQVVSNIVWTRKSKEMVSKNAHRVVNHDQTVANL
jgi:hypothetical protein